MERWRWFGGLLSRLRRFALDNDSLQSNRSGVEDRVDWIGLYGESRKSRF